MSNSYVIGTRQVPIRKVDVDYHETGIWVLAEGGTHFECTHQNVTTETSVIDYMDFSGPQQREVEVYACEDCGEALDGDPAEDRADAMADMQFEMGRE